MQLHSWEARPQANPSSAGMSCTPHPPQLCSAAWLGAKLLSISHPGVQGHHQGTVSSLAQSLRDTECAVHPAMSTQEHRGPGREKEPLGLCWPGLPPPPTLAHFLVHENPAHPTPRPASAGSWIWPAWISKVLQELSCSASHRAMPDLRCHTTAALATRTQFPQFHQKLSKAEVVSYP